MENLQETIQNKVSFYRDDMITYWKDLVNYQAGSKEAELITALLQKVADRHEGRRRDAFICHQDPDGSGI